MYSIILAGGFGKRLGTITKKVPKPLLKIGKKPFIFYLLDSLQKYRFKCAIICVHYLGEKFKDIFSKGYNQVKTIFSNEETPLGTGGAIQKALNFVKSSEPVLILNGDSFTNLNYREVLESHIKSKKKLTIVLKKIKSCGRYGQFIFDKKLKIKEFLYPGKDEPGYINIGVYVISKEIFNNENLSTSFSFESDFLVPKILEIEPNIFITKDYFIDIGIPEDYKKASLEIEKKIKSRDII